MVLVGRILCCIVAIGFSLYGIIDHQNRITKLRMEVPKLSKEVKALDEKERALRYELERFEDPSHLLRLAKQPEFGHLRYPQTDEVLILEREGS